MSRYANPHTWHSHGLMLTSDEELSLNRAVVRAVLGLGIFRTHLRLPKRLYRWMDSLPMPPTLVSQGDRYFMESSRQWD